MAKILFSPAGVWTSTDKNRKAQPQNTRAHFPRTLVAIRVPGPVQLVLPPVVLNRGSVSWGEKGVFMTWTTVVGRSPAAKILDLCKKERYHGPCLSLCGHVGHEVSPAVGGSQHEVAQGSAQYAHHTHTSMPLQAIAFLPWNGAPRGGRQPHDRMQEREAHRTTPRNRFGEQHSRRLAVGSCVPGMHVSTNSARATSGLHTNASQGVYMRLPRSAVHVRKVAASAAQQRDTAVCYAISTKQLCMKT